MDLYEAKEFLNQAGYELIDTIINEDISNPDEPATKKQLWALFCMTKKDHRSEGLTKGQASELISKLMAEKNGSKTSDKKTTRTNKTTKPEPAIEGIAVGDVFTYHHGYSMCLNAYVKVKSITGKKATVVEIGKDVVSGSLLQGRVKPNPDAEGEETYVALIRKDKYNDGNVILRVPYYGGGRYETFRKWDGKSTDYEDHMD